MLASLAIIIDCDMLHDVIRNITYFLSIVYIFKLPHLSHSFTTQWNGNDTQEGRHDWLAFHIIRVLFEFGRKCQIQIYFLKLKQCAFSLEPGQIPESSTLLLESFLYESNSNSWSLTAHMCSGSYRPMQWHMCSYLIFVTGATGGGRVNFFWPV